MVTIPKPNHIFNLVGNTILPRQRPFWKHLGVFLTSVKWFLEPRGLVFCVEKPRDGQGGALGVGRAGPVTLAFPRAQVALGFSQGKGRGQVRPAAQHA